MSLVLQMEIVSEVLICSAIFLVSCSTDRIISESSVSSEPSIRCEFTQESWCLFYGSRFVDKKKSNDGTTIWTLAGDFWKDNLGIIIEPNACRKKKADEVRILSDVKTVNFEGRLWSEAENSLIISGECNLKLLVPASGDDLFVSRFMPTQIGVCFEEKLCTENVLVSFISPFHQK